MGLPDASLWGRKKGLSMYTYGSGDFTTSLMAEIQMAGQWTRQTSQISNLFKNIAHIFARIHRSVMIIMAHWLALLEQALPLTVVCFKGSKMMGISNKELNIRGA